MLQEEIKSRVSQSPNNFFWSVRDHKEELCPLGGVSIEYVIEIHTSRCEFKTTMQSESAVVNFTISKTFKEVEYVYDKLKKQYSTISFPDFFKKSGTYLLESTEERYIILNKVLEFISEQSNLITSTIFLNFLNFDVNKQTNANKSQSSRAQNAKLKPKEFFDKVKIKSHESATQNEQTDGIFGYVDDDDLFKQTASVQVSESSVQSQESSTFHHSDEHLLFERQDLSFESVKHDKNVYVPLNDPSSTVQKDHVTHTLEEATELLRVDDSLSDILDEFQKKRPKPPVKKKPVIKPKPSLTITNEQSARPQSKAKPVPPPRATLCTKDGTTSSAAEIQSKSIGGPSPKPIAEEIDILDYITKEVDAQKENLDLF